MKIEITYPISSINIEANEPSQIIEGGDGKNFVTIEINRLIPNDFAKVMITLENDSLTADKIIMYHILDNDNPSEIQSSSVSGTHNNQQALLNAITAEGLVDKGSGYGALTQLKSLGISDFTMFPDLQYVYSQQPTIRLFVSSNEGDAEQSYLPLATAVP